MNFELDRELLLRCHRNEQLQRETEIARNRRALLADSRTTHSRAFARWRRRP